MRSIPSLTLAIATLLTGAHAHLKPGSLTPKGGETFSIGSKVLVSWVQTQAHDAKYDFYFSKNGGGSWTEFEANWQGPRGDGDTCKYEWTVPANAATTQGQLRVCQMAGGHCTDNNYILKSGNFTIEAASPVRPRAEAAAGRLEFDPVSGGVEIAFALQVPAKVVLQVFDARGRRLATLLDAEKAAGPHSLSLYSTPLRALHGAVTFKLSYGAESLSRAAVLP